MGCCSSRVIEDDALSPTESLEAPVPRGGNRPFSKADVSWTADAPITLKQLRKQRTAFWETAPSYEGRIEIWQALKYVCETEDLELAQVVIDSVKVTIPTGNLADGCYDELGNRYVIPAYCIVEPTNLMEDDDDDHTSQRSDDMDTKLLDQHETAPADHTITVRLSNSSKDVLLKINLQSDTVSTLRAKLCLQEGLDIGRTNVRFVFLGRLLDDKTSLADVKFGDGQLLQALITEKP